MLSLLLRSGWVCGWVVPWPFVYDIDFSPGVVIAALSSLSDVSFWVSDRGDMEIHHLSRSEAYMADILNTIVEIWITT